MVILLSKINVFHVLSLHRSCICELNHQILCKFVAIEDCIMLSLEHINYEYII